MFVKIISWLDSFVNEIVFRGLTNMQTFNKTHIGVLFSILAVGLLIFIVYRYIVYKDKTRRKMLKGLFYAASILMLFFMIYNETYVGNYLRNFYEINVVHLLYTFLPISLDVIGLILIGIKLYKKKDSMLIDNFLFFIIPFVGLSNLLFIDNFTIRNSYFIHLFVNSVLVFVPIYMAAFKIIKPSFKGLISSQIILLLILFVSLIFNYTFESIMPHSQMFQFYNYNYVSLPCNQFLRQTIMKYPNYLLMAFYLIMPIPLVYMLFPLMLLLTINLFMIAIYVKPQAMLIETKEFFSSPISYLRNIKLTACNVNLSEIENSSEKNLNEQTADSSPIESTHNASLLLESSKASEQSGEPVELTLLSNKKIKQINSNRVIKKIKTTDLAKSADNKSKTKINKD